MDPISAAIKQFQLDFHEFMSDSNAILLRVVTEPKDIGTLSKALRAEEWNPGNKSPFLIFETAFTRADETFDAMNMVIRGHYSVLKKSLDEDGYPLPDFTLPANRSQRPLELFASHVVAFHQGTKTILAPPLFCWLPTNVEQEIEWSEAIFNLVKFLKPCGTRFVFADINTRKQLVQALKPFQEQVSTVKFEIDDTAVMNYFQKLLMSPPSAGRAKGTMPGAAAPDVIPPKRPGPPEPTDAEIKAVIAQAGLPPVLTQTEAEKLRQFVLEAAKVSAEGDREGTIASQRAARDLCATSGAKLEQALMSLVLANYFLQFNLKKEAEAEYRYAESIAMEIIAYPQVAQIRMALACFLLNQTRVEEAALTYEQAAFSASVCDLKLLFLESLRMAGTCYLQLKQHKKAMLCWNAAVIRMRDASADEIRFSSFLDIVSLLVKLLKELRLEKQVLEVEAIVREAGARVNA
jgi:tetratricopeptide (TPR) repeat protein